jgi:hypothetical protein
MSNEWIELTDIVSVATAQANGWEIEVQTDVGNDKYCPWKAWDGKHWCAHYFYRGRPKQPKKVTVTSLCWRNKVTGSLNWLLPNDDMPKNWQRFPVGDLTGEVEE